MPLMIYDGSLDGLFSAFDHCRGDTVSGDEYTFAAADSPEAAAGSLFGVQRVETDFQRINRFIDGLEKAGGPGALQTLVHAFHADLSGGTDDLYRYTSLTLAKNRNIDGWLANDTVRRTTGMARRVMHETHRMKGLLRFMELTDGTFYAPFEPDHHILPFLAPYFSRRLAEQRWVIHDRRRHLAVLWDGSALRAAEVDPQLEAGLTTAVFSRSERFYQDCWRTFAREVAITSRRNPKLQRQCMPKKYWKYLPELGPVTEPRLENAVSRSQDTPPPRALP